jgi:demethylmenaquinone methyltransferase/2-methoxy-6-polyprenyl-1,4-benzoquinol methylase
VDELTDAVRRYYAARAAEYDTSAGYRDAEAGRLRAPLTALVAETFAGRQVLEVACGTGYWTEAIGRTAASVLATDVSEEMIAQARRRLARLENAEVRLADAYRLDGVPTGFTGGFAHWWLSHIPRELLSDFLNVFHSRLADGAVVLFIDHLPYEAPGRRVDANGNTIETRTLSGGRTFEIVKNFPDQKALKTALSSCADAVECREVAGSWAMRYHAKRGA